MSFIISLLADCLCPVKHDTAGERRLLINTIERPIPVDYEIVEEYVENMDGQIQFCKCFIPADRSSIKAMIFFCCGYGTHSHWMVHLNAIQFCQRGYVFFVFDNIGNGKSDGKHALITNFDREIVQNAKYLCAYGRRKYGTLFNLKKNQFFLMGESMGGAVAIKISLMKDQQGLWRGMLLASPMVYVMDELKPHWLLTAVVQKLVSYVPVIGELPLVPSPDLVPLLTRDKSLLKLLEGNPVRYLHKARLISGLNIKDACADCQHSMSKIEIPFIVIHGKADRVTSCKHSQMLFDQSVLCHNKKILLYEDTWHLILEEKHDIIYDDYDQWIMRQLSSSCSQESDDRNSNTC